MGIFIETIVNLRFNKASICLTILYLFRCLQSKAMDRIRVKSWISIKSKNHSARRMYLCKTKLTLTPIILQILRLVETWQPVNSYSSINSSHYLQCNKLLILYQTLLLWTNQSAYQNYLLHLSVIKTQFNWNNSNNLLVILLRIQIKIYLKNKKIPL